MKNIIDSYGCTFIFDAEKNKKIPNFNWIIDVLQAQTWEPVTFNIFDQHKDKNKIAIDIGGWKDTDITRFEKLIPLIKKVSRDTHEIAKSELLTLISLNVPESFLIEL